MNGRDCEIPSPSWDLPASGGKVASGDVPLRAVSFKIVSLSDNSFGQNLSCGDGTGNGGLEGGMCDVKPSEKWRRVAIGRHSRNHLAGIQRNLSGTCWRGSCTPVPFSSRGYTPPLPESKHLAGNFDLQNAFSFKVVPGAGKQPRRVAIAYQPF
jgi:hypothetical protein